MEFWVKLIEVIETKDGLARSSLHKNCTHVSNNYWLFEGDETGLDEGLEIIIVGEEAISSYGNLTGSQIKRMVLDTYNIDPCFLK